MNLEDRIMEEASKGNYNKDCRLKKKERKWIILKFPWSSTCAQSAEE